MLSTLSKKKKKRQQCKNIHLLSSADSEDSKSFFFLNKEKNNLCTGINHEHFINFHSKSEVNIKLNIRLIWILFKMVLPFIHRREIQVT